jgi:tetratricopeptide (TPR) repeat protein
MGIAYERGNLLYGQKRYAMAADEFRKELATDPNNASAMSMLALSLVFDGKREQGLEQARAAVTADPERAFCHYALACATVGMAPKFSQLAYIGVLSLFTRARWARFGYRRRAKKAKVPAMEAIRLSPGNPDFVALMSALELDLGRPRAALRWAGQGLAAQADHVRCANLRAKALSRLGRHAEAKETVKAALALNPDSAQSHATSGWTFLEANEPEKAQEHFEQSVRLNPTDERAIYGLKRSNSPLRWFMTPMGRATIILIVMANAIRTMAMAGNASGAVILAGIVVLIVALWALVRRFWGRHVSR